MINETVEVIIQSTKADLYNPIIITMWVSVLLVFLLATWITSFGKKIKWGNFWAIWSLTAVISGILVLIFTSSPNTVLDILNWVKGFIGI